MSIKKVVDLETIKKVLTDNLLGYLSVETQIDLYMKLVEAAHEEPQAGWTSYDVLCQYPNLTQEQAETVLQLAVKKSDAGLGFTYDNITWAAEELQKDLDLNLDNSEKEEEAKNWEELLKVIANVIPE